MSNFIAAYQNFLMIACMSILLAMGLAYLTYKIAKGAKDVWKRTKSLGILALMAAGIIYGGSKSSISPANTSTDDEIDLLDIELVISNEVVEVAGNVETNFANATIVISVSEESPVPQPMWFRESVYQTWTNIMELATWTTAQPVLDPDLSGNGTNVYKWTSLDWTNNYSHASWYIGTDLPPVEIDVTDKDYIVLDEFNMTSKKVWIKFHLADEFSYPEGTKIEIQRKTENGAWRVVDELEAVRSGSYSWQGFAVGKRTVWRLHIAITEME